MLRRTLTTLFTLAALGGIAAPAFASPASATPAAASYGVQICARINTSYCLSAKGEGLLVVLTNNDRTNFLVQSVNNTTYYHIVVSNETTHCLIKGSGAIVTTGSCTGDSLWTISGTATKGYHFYNALGKCNLGTSSVGQNSAVTCVTPRKGVDWTWKEEPR